MTASRSHRLLRSLLAAALVAGARPVRPAEDWKGAKDAAQTVLETINVQTTGKFTKVILQSSAPLRYRDLQQGAPPVLYLYMSAPTVSRRPVVQKVYGDLLEEIRVGYKGGGTPEKDALPVEYILFKLTEPASVNILQKEWVLVVEMQPKGGPAPATKAPEAAVSDSYVPELPRRKGRQPLSLPASPSLRDFLDVGLANNGNLQIAQEEYRLSKMRYFEASRALFPSLTGRYETSTGRLLLDPNDPADDTDFRRKEIGLQVGQPIFQSGRLYYSLRQASMQKRISAQNVLKAKAETAFEVTKAYHNLLKAQHALKARQELKERADKLVDLARKKKQLEIITEAEALGVESQYNQLYYRTLSDEKDLQLARLRLQALLNTPEALPVSVPDPLEPFDPKKLPKISAPVETLVEQALLHRPEMITADYSARFQTYGEKVAKAENRLRLDASGFVGKSGGAFTQAESIQLRSSWNVGLQASTYFLGNSLRGTGTGEKTSPDLGETSRTETQARSANVGFLDGLKQISDRRQATINKEKALFERDQTRRNVEIEVREAFYSLEKARLQLLGAQIEYDYREKELHIARQKERMNLIDPSQALTAESQYTEAIVSREEAVAFFLVSAASMEKALGMPLDGYVEIP